MIIGPAEHGVVRFAEQVLAALQHPGPVVRAVSVGALPADWLDSLRGCASVHLQYTDALYAPRCEDAAVTFLDLAARLHGAGHRCTVTLHDLPQPADGPGLYPRRAKVYRMVAGAADRVVVSSEHESSLLAELGDDEQTCTVIPLPVDPPDEQLEAGPGDGQVTMLGFVHPGKGHREVLAAMRTLPATHGLVVLGRAGAGHDDLVTELRAAAGEDGRPLAITGFLPETALHARLHQAGVPVAAHRNVSASGSINSWLGAGRRPLVPEGRYAAELAGRNPGALWTYSPGELPDTLALALAEPERTFLTATPVLGPTTAAVATRYAELWAGP
ncbi:MAG: hypothetical protein ABI160_02565 [Mycobacteriaceae bacterium]